MNNNNNYAETFRTMEGRTYRNEVNVLYYLPSDDKEMDRIGVEHFLLRYRRGNFSSKIEKSGSGGWLIDMSFKYPLSTFISIDISVSFPSKENTPDNLAFLKYNLIEHPDVPFPDKTFDYVFLRNLVFKIRDNEHVIYEAVRVINLDGCIEVMNYDFYKDNSTEIYGGPIFSKLQCSSMYNTLQYHTIILYATCFIFIVNGLHERDNMTAAETVAYLRLLTYKLKEGVSNGFL